MNSPGLLWNATIKASDIKIHCTPTVSECFKQYAEESGATIVPVEPFVGNHGYCNKINQMFSSAFEGYDRAILCDCDLFFVKPINVCEISAPVAGKVVDRPNPPLEQLQSIFSRYGLKSPQMRPVDFPQSADEKTFATNWNGGLYVMAAPNLAAWGEVWRDYARDLIRNIEILTFFGAHVDQIAWAMTITKLDLGFQLLDASLNFPTHLGRLLESVHTDNEILALHYHNTMDASGKIRTTGVAALDRAIEAANAGIDSWNSWAEEDEDFRKLRSNWRRIQSISVSKSFDSAKAEPAASPPALKKITTLHGEFLAFPGDLITTQLEQYGAHTRNELSMVLDCVAPGNTVVDIGAHIGTYAIPLAKKVGEKGRVLAIEADIEIYRVLTENIEINRAGEIITPVNAIVGDPRLRALARKSVPGNTGAGYYVVDESSGNSASDAARLLVEHGFGAPDLIKIDVEGMELGVLSSLREMLAARKPKLYIEISAEQLARHNATVEEIDALLRNLGYRFYRNVGQGCSTLGSESLKQQGLTI